MSAGGNLWAQVKMGAAAGVLSGGYPFAGNIWYVGQQSPIFGRRVDTIADAFNIMTAKDILLLGPQQHEEGNLVIPESLSNITIIGAGNRGACFIEPADTADEGLQVLADDVTIMNVGIASGATSSYSLKVGSQTISPNRFRAYGCKIEGNEGANPAAQAILQGTGDVIFDDCEFCWGVNGVVGQANDNGFPTQTLLRNCWFHDLTTVHIGINAGDHFVELWLRDNFFDRDEAGAAPTDFILLSDNANTGVITGNRFANATNATGVITIGTGLLYMANATEAGWSTARPA